MFTNKMKIYAKYKKCCYNNQGVEIRASLIVNEMFSQIEWLSDVFF